MSFLERGAYQVQTLSWGDSDEACLMVALGANLSGANLLSRANLSRANLTRANLSARYSAGAN